MYLFPHQPHNRPCATLCAHESDVESVDERFQHENGTGSFSVGTECEFSSNRQLLSFNRFSLNFKKSVALQDLRTMFHHNQRHHPRPHVLAVELSPSAPGDLCRRRHGDKQTGEAPCSSVPIVPLSGKLAEISLSWGKDSSARTCGWTRWSQPWKPPTGLRFA